MLKTAPRIHHPFIPTQCQWTNILLVNKHNTFSVSLRQTFGYSSLSESKQNKTQPIPAVKRSWFSRLPERWTAYAHLSRAYNPTGTFLLYSPCTWSILMGAYSINSSLFDVSKMLALFGVGSFLMRSAGCVVNDLWDRKLDAKVERSKSRPLASRLVSVREGVSVLGVQLTASLGILLQLNPYTIKLGVASLLPVCIYPAMKRITYYPQVVLGLTFGYGAVMGWPALVGEACMNWSVVAPLYLSAVSWIVLYDTIYAHQDKRDDVKANVYSMALRYGDNTKPVLTGLALFQLSMLTTAGICNSQGPLFYTIGVAGAAYRIFSMIYKVNLDSPKDCFSWFKKNSNTGFLVTAAIALDWLAKAYTS
ncbi:para-hydroxybenzoate-polyprenyltransferaseCoq2 [Schizosaccharomyces cryophilus OY26]|uniref:4-hydroxybenzoate polyprenyltransferase, mitochondrial n=1 Tax=Schizosaccharomyces cryophilus (strain OY26 / ATCC MYA-4695 / CBS 11777 / NBRC 106824 / NRRL Y48691) TaxID=653667 RepID=S9X156_SCHCR|nr:para-hydroxybenzoate-polyprenyltransferaseCoq2 [Schizosaccharomyces cryophilus OY26]EPY50822.1 para-hydroxybenzoate-polyprenyltransferaseCoq2 [Schizosaccharomyces cryophilus OY26]